MPWTEATTDSTDLHSAREVLDADHDGLKRSRTVSSSTSP